MAQRQHAWNKLFWCPVVDFIEFFSERAKSSLHFEAFKATFLKSSRTSPITLHLHGIHEQTDLPPTHSNPSKDTSLPRVLSSHTETLLPLTLQRERRKAVISSRFLSLSRCVSPQQVVLSPSRASTDKFISKTVMDARKCFLILIFTKK